jgi:hypothetical protein
MIRAKIFSHGFHLYASMHLDVVDKRAFNIADGIPEVVTWDMVRGGIRSYFGLRGVPPNGSRKSPKEWVLSRKSEWPQLGNETGNKKKIQQALEATRGGFHGYGYDAATGGMSGGWIHGESGYGSGISYRL